MEFWQENILAVAIFMWTVIPMYWYDKRKQNKKDETLLLQNQSHMNQLLLDNKQWMQKIADSFSSHSQEDDQNFKEILKAIYSIKWSVWKTSLKNWQLIEIAKARVWLTSEKKLSFIKDILQKNNLQERKGIVKLHIRTELERRSEEYIIFLNWFTSDVWLLWDWVAINFPMDLFMEELYDVIFRIWEENHIKIEDCRFVMSKYQMALWQKLKKDLKDN